MRPVESQSGRVAGSVRAEDRPGLAGDSGRRWGEPDWSARGELGERRGEADAERRGEGEETGRVWGTMEVIDGN
jgi:hypothetical protein